MKFCTFLAAAFMVAVVSGDDTYEKVQTKKSKRKNCAALGYTDSLMCSNCDKMVEYFDSVGFTRRDGNSRFVRTNKENIFGK